MLYTCRFEVPDVEAACKRFEDLGVQFVKKPNDGKMKGLAFIKVCSDLLTLSLCELTSAGCKRHAGILQDPDNYWIEIFNGTASRAFAE